MKKGKNKILFTALMFGFVIMMGSAFAVGEGGPQNPSDRGPLLAPVPSAPTPTDADATKSDTGKLIYPLNKSEYVTYEDLNSKSPADLKDPSNVRHEVEYDPDNELYIYTTKVGDMDISTPFVLNQSQYQEYSLQQQMNQYWNEKNATNVDDGNKFSLSEIKVGLGQGADKVFGPGGVQLKTQGSVDLTFGIKHTKRDNPSISERNRKTTIFDFDTKIQLSANGKVGDRVKFNMNYNTEATFDFDQQLINLSYEGKEDNIIKKIEAGNVSMPLSTQLISGTSALFGIRTDMQFGKLRASLLASQKESDSKTITTKGGAQTTEFEINASDYEVNRHFFLSQFFRENYDEWMKKIPTITSGVVINKVEIWVTNTSTASDKTTRNIIAFTNLGEDSENPAKVNPQNTTNKLYSTITSSENSGIRTYGSNDMSMLQYDGKYLENGIDYENLNSARLLSTDEYTLNPYLGYISLRSTLNTSDVLAVAYQYTYMGKTYKVGEFSTDRVSSDTTSSSTLFVKLLKSTSSTPANPVLWNMMMKNVYSLGAYNVSSTKFKLDVEYYYSDDSISSYLKYLPVSNIKKTPLVKVLGLDRLNSRSKAVSDGFFDFVDGYTVDAKNGRIYFPSVEPFGSYLASKITDKEVAKKYAFDELYDMTQTEAKEYTEKDKFVLRGEYQSSSGSQIRLGATNVPRGSVTVTAGGRTLVENEGYTVDYNLGIVTILDEVALTSNTPISVKLESESFYSTQRKSLVGADLQYQFNDKFSIGGTLMHLNEKPLTEKVSYGEEPISNTIWGLNAAYNTQTQWLTNVIDKLPLINATAPSSFAVSGEFAQLIPGHSSAVDQNGEGVSYIDDFEGTKSTINIMSPTAWMLASTPYISDATAVGHKFIRSSDSFWGNDLNSSLGNLGYGLNRAHFAWFHIDQILNNVTTDTPKSLRDNADEQSNHFTRLVHEKEIYKNRQEVYGESTIVSTLNLSYYPTERGPYNLDVSGMNPDGTLSDPESRWGGIMRKLDNTDFKKSNVEYIEFWLMDPFVYDDMNTSSGKLVFNLGEISEDVMKDGRITFENGMPTGNSTNVVDSTIWGRVPRIQATIYAFDNDNIESQDVGLDGLNDEMEMAYAPSYAKYVDAINKKLNAEGRERFSEQVFNPLNDPAGDNFHHYLGSDYNDAKKGILDRYKYYNGTEGNSSSSSSNYSSSTIYPDVEDLNSDHTLNEKEQYFEYVINLDKNILRDKNRWAESHIASAVEYDALSPKNNKEEDKKITWYQFKIPIEDYDRIEGAISNFQSIRFIRMYMTDFATETYLRFGALNLVRTDWRVYSQNKNLFDTEAGQTADNAGKGSIAITAVNIEDDEDKVPVGYILPPGIDRTQDPSQSQVREENEQSMLIKIDSLGSKQARAAYKTTTLDTRQYKRLKMFVHAENRLNEEKVGDNHLYLFFRMGSDFTENYYEYQVPLVITQDGATSKEDVWPSANAIDFAFSTFTDLKLRRDKLKASGNVHVTDRYTEMDGDNIITVVGTPSFGEITSLMIGIRNEDYTPHSADIWVNELRMVGFDEDGGCAGLANLGVVFSDLGSLSLGGKIESAGFGGIEDNVEDRRTDNFYEYNLSASLQLGKLFPEKAKVNMPISYTLTKSLSKPEYDPLNSDIKLDDNINNQTTQAAKDSIKEMSVTTSTYQSVTLSNVRVGIVSEKPMPYDPGNFSFTLGYNETKDKDPDTEYNITRNYNGILNYNYSTSPKAIEPFKNIKALKSNYLKLIREFNFYLYPQSYSFSTNMKRYYNETQLRDFSVSYDKDTTFPYMSWDKDFTWSRTSDIKFNLSKTLKLTFASAMDASIDEIIRDENGNYRDVPINKSYLEEVGEYDWYDRWKDTVWSSIRHFGTPVEYYQRFSGSWNVPINKLPYLDWVTANAQYSADYTWNRGAETQLGSGISETGNIAVNKRNWNGDLRLNFETLYNYFPYLKAVNKKYGNVAKKNNKKKDDKNKDKDKDKDKDKKDDKSGKDSKDDEKAKKEAAKPKIYERKNIRLKKDVKTRITHRLGTSKLTVTLTDKDGKIVDVKYKVVDDNVINLISKEDMSGLSMKIVGTIKEHKPIDDVVEVASRILMSFRNASASYRQTEALTLNGYKPESGFLGQDHNAPGYDFTFGFYNMDNYLQKVNDKGWMTDDSTLVTNPVIKTKEQNLQVKTSVVPFPGIKIDLNAAWMKSRSDEIYYMYENSNTFTGTYSRTHIALRTAFKGKKMDSELFNNFLSYRNSIRRRVETDFTRATGITDRTELNNKLLNTTSDVLVPAFYAAYSGTSVENSALNLLPNALSMLPNWKVTIDALSRLPFLQDKMKSLNLTHGYKCTYNINSYTSLTDWNDLGGGYGEVSGTSEELDNGYFSSAFTVDNVNINESFSPLLGAEATLNNSLQLKMEWKKSRTDGLDISALQVVESYSDEYVFGTGYRIDDFGGIIHLNNNKQKAIKNDLNLRLDLSYKSTDAYIRKIVDNYSQLSSGINSFIIKFSADYVFSSRLNIRFYYDRTASTPKVSSSYPTVNCDFGIGLKLLLSK